jgi:hypothetical protein
MATKAQLKEEVKTLLAQLECDPSEEAVPVIHGIVEYMRKHKLDTTDIVRDYMDIEVYANLTAEQREALKNPPAPVVRAPNDISSMTLDEIFSAKGGVSSEIKINVAVRHIDNLYKHGKLATDTTAGFRLLQITDVNDKIVNKLSGTPGDIQSEVMSSLANYLKGIGEYVSNATLKEMYEYWKHNSEKIGQVMTESGCEDGVLTCTSTYLEKQGINVGRWALHKATHLPDKKIPFSLIKGTLERMSAGDEFAAWVWGVFSGSYKGRQILWLAGLYGEEGKSYLLKFIGKTLFGENKGFRSLSNAQIKGGSKFTTSAYVGVKFLVYPDCNNPHLLSIELFKMLAGGGRDSVELEEKFKSSSTGTLDTRIAVAANLFPEVKQDNWYLSRLLLIEIKPFKTKKDPNIDLKYELEMPGFLAYAKECYERLCPDDENIELSNETNGLIQNLLAKSDPLKKDIFLRNFAIDANSKITFKKVFDILEVNEDVKGSKAKEDYKEYFESLPGVSVKRDKKGMVFEGMAELKHVVGNTKPTTSEIDSLDGLFTKTASGTVIY